MRIRVLSSIPLTIKISIATWMVAVLIGFVGWHIYEATPGRIGFTPSEELSLSGRPSVVIFVHPHCTCTREVLPELLVEFATVTTKANVKVLFVCPKGVPSGWERTKTWEIAANSIGVGVNTDSDGIAAVAEGAETSGFVVARDKFGHVKFRGGIARNRKNKEDPGRQAVMDVLAGRVPQISEAPVFGCPLFAP